MCAKFAQAARAAGGCGRRQTGRNGSQRGVGHRAAACHSLPRLPGIKETNENQRLRAPLLFITIESKKGCTF